MLLYAQRLAAHCPETAAELHHLPAVGGPLADLITPPFALPRLSDGIAHVVDHAHAGYLRHLRVPSLVTVHDLIPLKVVRGRYPAEARPLVSRKAALWFRWNVRALPRADLVVAPSEATAGAIRDLIGDLRIEVVPHGIDPEFFAPPGESALQQVRERLAPLGQRRIVLQVSNGFFYKNDAGFASAMERLARDRSDVAWVRVGSPLPEQPATPCPAYHYAEASLAELVALYHRADVLLFPSWDEGFGWPPLEAMAAGCPVVASACGALKETAAPAARVVDPADPEQLAQAVSRILDDTDTAAELVRRGRVHAGGFDWARVGARMAELYREVAGCV